MELAAMKLGPLIQFVRHWGEVVNPWKLHLLMLRSMLDLVVSIIVIRRVQHASCASESSGWQQPD